MDVRESLLNAVDEVLDKMAFLFFEEAESEDEVSLDPAYITEVNLSGVITGTLNIFLSEGTAKLVARNLLGIREDDELFEDTLGDALGEFTNLVGGRTMTILHPPGPFNMEIPRVVEGPAAPQEGQIELFIHGHLEEEPFHIKLQYKETPL